jgi:SAM-dependent methyltransferase
VLFRSFDAFLAARQVGPAGRVIGVDMTPEMIDLARRNAEKMGLANVTFHQAEIERLPLGNDSVDVVMSNCVINLSPDKAAVYGEIFRVLKPGGRLAISDVVSLAPLPAEVKQDLALWAACAAGAMVKADLEALLAQLGFVEVHIQLNPASAGYIRQWLPGRGLEDYLAAASLTARKPGGRVEQGGH